MRIAVAQLGARMHYAVPRIFEEAGLLERLFTDSYSGNKPWLAAGLRAVPPRLRPRGVERWLGRTSPNLPIAKVRSFEAVGLFGAGMRAMARNGRNRAKAARKTAILFNRAILQEGLGHADVVWGFSGDALELFAEAKRRGLRCVLEQTIISRSEQRTLLRHEMEQWPSWEPDLSVPELEREERDHEEKEWDLADLVVCGSDFVRTNLLQHGVSHAKCKVVPYGIDLDCYGHHRQSKAEPEELLRVLFAGQVGLRKGAPYILEALRICGPSAVTARFAGGVILAEHKTRPYATVASFLGAVPRARMRELYSWADVLVLPSICEGSATVLYEAAAHGIPVICTPNAGPPPLDHGLHIVKKGSIEELVAALSELCNRKRQDGTVRYTGSASAKIVSFQAYRSRLLKAVNQQLSQYQ